MANDFLFTSESVSEGHPDKVVGEVFRPGRTRAEATKARNQGWRGGRYNTVMGCCAPKRCA